MDKISIIIQIFKIILLANKTSSRKEKFQGYQDEICLQAGMQSARKTYVFSSNMASKLGNAKRKQENSLKTDEWLYGLLNR